MTIRIAVVNFGDRPIVLKQNGKELVKVYPEQVSRDGIYVWGGAPVTIEEIPEELSI